MTATPRGRRADIVPMQNIHLLCGWCCTPDGRLTSAWRQIGGIDWRTPDASQPRTNARGMLQRNDSTRT